MTTIRCCILALTAALSLACGPSGSAPESEDVQAQVADGTPDRQAGVDLTVLADQKEGTELPPVFEVVGDVPLSPCQPGKGCFLDPCTSNADCHSGWCVEHLGEGLCTQTCQEECPQGWLCKQVGGTDPDVVFICVSDFANLCKPCTDNADCESQGGAEDVCVSYGDEGSFCGGQCAVDTDCPWGFSCLDAQTTAGIETKQCVADAGVCPCTAKSVALALYTPCAVASDWGECVGKRVCTEEGLSDCDALVPQEEQCDGEDNDCDGDVDEPNLEQGAYVPLCEDGNDCTTDACNGSDGCSHTLLDEGSCDDGNPCTVADHCSSGTCLGDPVECDDENPCTENVCTPSGGCEYTATSGSCDDGDPCTLADQCLGGTCEGTPINCDCQADEDCAILEDGDPCNGTLVCDTSELPFKCVVDPDTVVSCPHPTGPQSFCLAASCDPESGECLEVPAHEGFLCDNGDACTYNDTCTQGVCGGGQSLACDDGNPCTLNTCDPEQGCLAPSPLSDTPCDDKSVCTLADICVDGTCTGAQALDCNDDNPCTDDTCDSEQGCITKLNQAPCDDDNLCTTGDHCHLGQCLSGNPLPCEDLNPCTDDSCDPSLGCLHEANDKPCDDGNACTTNDQCGKGVCLGKDPVPCSDGNPCTDDWCDPLQGCQSSPNDAACNDGNACTLGEFCNQGECGGGDSVDCDDGNPCTADSCSPEQGCIFEPQDLPCDDGSLCTTGDACNQGVCEGGEAVSCDDDRECTVDSCDPKTGCKNVVKVLGTPCGPGLAYFCVNDECLPEMPESDFEDNFMCDNSNWTFANPSAPVVWAIDATPANPGFYSPDCSLNFNNGTNFSGSGKVSGSATSQPFIATVPGPGQKLHLEFMAYLDVESSASYDILTVTVADTASQQQVSQKVTKSPLKNWTKHTLDITSLQGKTVKITFSFDSKDGISNNGTGIFIDDVIVHLL